MHKVLVNRIGGLSLPRISVVRLTDRPNMILDVYRGRKTTIQQFIILITSFYVSLIKSEKLLLSLYQTKSSFISSSIFCIQYDQKCNVS